MQGKGVAYSVAILTTLLYSAWYISLSFLANYYNGAYSPIFSFLLIFIILSVMRFASAQGNLHLYAPSDAIYPLVSGLFYSIGNYVFYVLIYQNGVQFASSFASAEIIFFVIMLWISGKKKSGMALYAIGSVLIAAGLIMESAVLGDVAVAINAKLFEYGLLMAFLYGMATYFYYLSTLRIKSITATMFYITITEAVAFLFMFVLLYNVIILPKIGISYLLLITVSAVMLFFSFFAETWMMKLLAPLGEGTVATGYILSDLELLPVMFYAIAINPASWASFVPGMLIITVGMALLDWKRSA
ncbi:MAG: hypothetical protein QXZ01_01685 [Candidatus Micrarchaeaceae archaeon]